MSTMKSDLLSAQWVTKRGDKHKLIFNLLEENVPSLKWNCGESPSEFIDGDEYKLFVDNCTFFGFVTEKGHSSLAWSDETADNSRETFEEAGYLYFTEDELIKLLRSGLTENQIEKEIERMDFIND